MSIGDVPIVESRCDCHAATRRSFWRIPWILRLSPIVILVAVAARLAVGRVQAPLILDAHGKARKVIFLGPGCGHVAYSLGLIGAALDDDELRSAIIASGAVFGGTSSGALVAGYAAAVIHGVGQANMDDWYPALRRGFEAVGNHSTLVMGEELERAAYRYCERCEEALNVQQLPWTQHFPLSFTELPSLRAQFRWSFASTHDVVRAVTASSFVPGVMGLQPWVSLPAVADGTANRSAWVFDGFIGLLSTAFPREYLFVHFLPTIPSMLLGAEHQLYAYEWDSTGGGLLGVFWKSWPWGDPLWADRAFARGRADGKANIGQMRQQIVEFLQS